MTYTDFKNKWIGRGIDYDGAYGFQCVDLINQYCKEVTNKPFPFLPAAKDFWGVDIDGYDKIANTPDGVPQQGDILIWGTGVGPYGHIAIFDSGDSNSFVSLDQNWPVNSLVHLQNHNYNGLLGWFHPQSQVNDEMMQISKGVFALLMFKATAYDAFVKDNFPDVASVHKAIDELVQAGRDKDNEIFKKTGQIEELTAALSTCRNQLQVPLPGDLVTAQAFIKAVHGAVYDRWSSSPLPVKWYWKTQLRRIKKIFES